MSIYHLSIKNISRNKGQAIVASAAYRAGERLIDRKTGITYDYTRKSGIEYSEIILCENAPREYKDREVLWNEVEKIEKASDARLAREWEVAIPKELTKEQGQQLVRDFAKSLAGEGMCIDFSIHDKGNGNRRAHILGTTRPIRENGRWGAKEKKVYDLDEIGNRIPIMDSTTGKQKVDGRNRKQWKRKTIQANDWNKTEKVEEWRCRWARECNKYLKQEQQIDHRSYKRQGKKIEPTIHEGYVARQIEKNGRISELCEHNRQVTKRNEMQLFTQKALRTMTEKLLGFMQEKDFSQTTKYRKIERKKSKRKNVI